MDMYGVFFAACVMIVLALAQDSRRLKLGDGCRLENKKKGICRSFSDCPAAIKDLADNDKWPLLCQYNGDTSVVCCDELAAPETTTSKVTSMTSTTTTTQATTTTTRRYNSNTRAPPGILSRRMCQEYSRWLIAPTLSFIDVERIPGQCGAYVETVIYDGDAAQRLEFPHMAHLGFTNGGADEDPDWSCGGSLISEEFILTAGHCLRKNDGTFVTHVRLGSGDVSSESIVKVESLIPHPGYKRKSVYNDIALIKLKEKVKFTDYRRPACLQANRHFKDTHGVASGWGVTEDDSTGSDILLKVKLPFLSYEECSKTYVANPISLPKGLDDKTMICAGGINYKKDTCQGDSGGPLQIILKEPHCMYSIVAVTSFGIKCGIAPGVYTRVSAFVPWIESIVWPNQ